MFTFFEDFHFSVKAKGEEVHTGLQSQFSFWLCTTWLDAVYFLQMSLSNRLLSPGMRRKSASILWTYENDEEEWDEARPRRGAGHVWLRTAEWYLVPLSAHQEDAEHVQNLHLVHDLVDGLHGLGQPVSQRAGGQRTLVWWLWRGKQVEIQTIRDSIHCHCLSVTVKGTLSTEYSESGHMLNLLGLIFYRLVQWHEKWCHYNLAKPSSCFVFIWGHGEEIKSLENMKISIKLKKMCNFNSNFLKKVPQNLK